MVSKEIIPPGQTRIVTKEFKVDGNLFEVGAEVDIEIIENDGVSVIYAPKNNDPVVIVGINPKMLKQNTKEKFRLKEDE